MGRDGRISDGADATAQAPLFTDLPPPGTMRWVPRRKAQVVAAVRGGTLSLDDACQRYALTVEEFLSWQHAIDNFGLMGLRAKYIKGFRTPLR